MKKLLLTVALLLVPVYAGAQGIGQITSGQVVGNSSAVTRTPTGTSLTALFDRAFCSTNGQVVSRVAGVWTCASPGAAVLTVGSSAVTGGVTTRILFDNAGVLGEYSQASGRVFLGVDQRTTVADAAYPMAATDYVIDYTSLSAARIVTLIAASTTNPGRFLWIFDSSGNASTTNTISVAPNGADTINGSNTTQVVVSGSFGGVYMESNGTNGWFVRKLNFAGDVTSNGTVGSTFTTTIATNAVTYAKFQQVAAVSLVGNATGGLANATGITLGATLAFSGSALQTLAHTGDVTTAANSFVTTIAANAVTNAKMAQAAANTVKSNFTGAPANVTDFAIPSCPDSGGNHLNYISGTGIICGATGPGGTAWPSGGGPANGNSGGIPYFNSTTTVLSSATLTSFGVVYGGGLAGSPVSTAAGTTGQLFLGVTGAAPQWGTMSGDAAIGNTGVITITNNAVTLAKIATQATNTVLGNATAGSAIPTALAVGTCSTAASALIWTTNTGFGCNTAITAAAVPVGGITGLGTGVATALAVNIGTAGSFVVNGGALGSPSSAGTLPAHTLGGTISGGGNQINNVIIGSSTPLAGTFTVLTGTSGSITGLTGLAIRDTSAAFDVTIAAVSSAALSAGRTLTLNMQNVAHILSFGTTANTGTGITFQNAATQTVTALNLAGQVIAGGATVTALTQTAGNLTVDCGLRPLQFQTNSGAFTLTAPAADGSCILLSTNDGTAGAITFSGFSVGSSTGDALTTTNTNKFSIHIWRVNGVSGYRVAAHQ